MKIKWISILIFILLLTSCISETNNSEVKERIQYNLIQPGNGIYVITKKNVEEKQTSNFDFEKVYYENDKKVKIQRYNKKGNLSDDFSVAAVTKFEYDPNGNVKFIKYFDKNNTPAEDDLFGYWSIEYIYDEQNRVRMEIYRDAENKFLTVPRDNSGKIAKINFISPVLTYEYLGDQLKIKALDKNFNLLKEVYGDKPCIPFIDCGEND
jgi:hypothetical protein